MHGIRMPPGKPGESQEKGKDEEEMDKETDVERGTGPRPRLGSRALIPVPGLKRRYRKPFPPPTTLGSTRWLISTLPLRKTHNSNDFNIHLILLISIFPDNL